jgi:3-dehydroquinate dehydratase
MVIYKMTVIELHMRERFWHHFVLAAFAKVQMCGFGFDRYLLALRTVVSVAQTGHAF